MRVQNSNVEEVFYEEPVEDFLYVKFRTSIDSVKKLLNEVLSKNDIKDLIRRYPKDIESEGNFEDDEEQKRIKFLYNLKGFLKMVYEKRKLPEEFFDLQEDIINLLRRHL
ncbi:unnamed protein product [Gordionus sp. m RMFG-2023]